MSYVQRMEVAKGENDLDCVEFDLGFRQAFLLFNEQVELTSAYKRHNEI
jgi:hypothetical protein